MTDERSQYPDYAQRLREWICERLQGKCRIISEGDSCTCALCDFDRMWQAARAAPAQDKEELRRFWNELNEEATLECPACGKDAQPASFCGACDSFFRGDRAAPAQPDIERYLERAHEHLQQWAAEDVEVPSCVVAALNDLDDALALVRGAVPSQLTEDDLVELSPEQVAGIMAATKDLVQRSSVPPQPEGSGEA